MGYVTDLTTNMTLNRSLTAEVVGMKYIKACTSKNSNNPLLYDDYSKRRNNHIKRYELDRR